MGQNPFDPLGSVQRSSKPQIWRKGTGWGRRGRDGKEKEEE